VKITKWFKKNIFQEKYDYFIKQCFNGNLNLIMPMSGIRASCVVLGIRLDDEEGRLLR